jgi:uncharacterized protein YraI
LLVIPANALVGLTGSNQNGYFGVTYGTTQGWADGAYLTPDTAGTTSGQLSTFAPAPATTAAPAPASGEVQAVANLNLRAGPGVDSAILTVVPRGGLMVLSGESINGDVAVNYNGVAGWVDAAYLG